MEQSHGQVIENRRAQNGLEEQSHREHAKTPVKMRVRAKTRQKKEFFFAQKYLQAIENIRNQQEQSQNKATPGTGLSCKLMILCQIDLFRKAIQITIVKSIAYD